MKLISEGWPEGDEILLDSISCTFLQDADCTENRDTPQEITLSTRDGGGGKFVNIKTKSWSIDSEQTLVNLIKEFKKIYESIDNS